MCHRLVALALVTWSFAAAADLGLLSEERVDGVTIRRLIVDDFERPRIELHFDRGATVEKWLFAAGAAAPGDITNVMLRLTSRHRLAIFFDHQGFPYFTPFPKTIFADDLRVENREIILYRSVGGGEVERARLLSVTVHVDEVRHLLAQSFAAAGTGVAPFVLNGPAVATAAIAGTAAMVLVSSCSRLLYGGINRPRLKLSPWHRVPIARAR